MSFYLLVWTDNFLVTDCTFISAFGVAAAEVLGGGGRLGLCGGRADKGMPLH